MRSKINLVLATIGLAVIVTVRCSDLLAEEDVTLVRVRRQVQSLITVLQQNPALVQQLQQNPVLLQTLQSQLQQQQLQLQQQQQQQQLLSPLSLVGNIPLVSNQDDGNCAALRKQNKLFRQMLLSVAGEDHPGLGAADPRELLQAATSNPAQDLLERAVGGGAGVQIRPDELVTSVLVTPTPIWQTEESATTFVTTVTETASTEVPIILRGKKIITTILNEETKTVTATETSTSSSLITPTPTWSTFVITQTPSIDLLSETFSTLQPDDKPPNEDNRPKKRNNSNGVVQAQVIEIDETTTPRASKLDRFREAYGSYFASSAQRSAQRFGDSFKRISGNGEDQLEEFDQQVQPANNRPVYVPSPHPPSHKEFTLYFSGKAPGEFTTKVTALPVDAAGRPIRAKRAAIHPSKVEPIEHTLPPQENQFESFSKAQNDVTTFDDELQSSIPEACQPGSVTTVTVTETLTITKL